MISKFLIKVGNRSKWKKKLRSHLLKKSYDELMTLSEHLPKNYSFLGLSLRDAFLGHAGKNTDAHIDIRLLQKQLFASKKKLTVNDYGSGSWLRDRFSTDDGSYKTVIKRVNMMSWLSAKPPVWALFLMNIVAAKQPKRVLELGTNLGLSSLHIASALPENGRLVTLEGADSIAEVAKTHFKQFKHRNIDVVIGAFHDTLPKVLSKEEPFDVVFIDGHHNGDATERYFNQIKPFLSEDAVVIFDDINWSKDMRKAWKTIIKQNEICVSLDLFSMGVIVCHSGSNVKVHRRIKLI